FFFFQAEDGIRDFHVTGVQTCALPILFLVKRPRSVAAKIFPSPSYKRRIIRPLSPSGAIPKSALGGLSSLPQLARKNRLRHRTNERAKKAIRIGAAPLNDIMELSMRPEIGRAQD